MSQNVLKALVRSLMPLVYAAVAAAIAHFGYHVSNVTVIRMVTVGFAALTVILHSLEVKFPWVGVFLGWFGAPAYAPSVKKTQAQQIAEQAQQIIDLQGKVKALSTAPSTS